MEFEHDYFWDADSRFPLSDRFATASAASTAIATRLHGRVVKRVPFHHHRRRMRDACARGSGKVVAREKGGSKTKTNTAEEEEYEGRKGEMIARRRDSVENASESVQFPFPMPPIPPPRIGGCSLVGRSVGLSIWERSRLVV